MMQELSAIVGSTPQPEKVAGGFQFADGPVFSRKGYLLFTDGPSNRIMRHAGGQTSVFRENSNRASALTFDHQGRLLACEKGRVTRTEKDGKITVLAGSLIAPNDLVYAIDGSIYVTDPPLVYQITRQGELRQATLEVVMPNGLALDPKQLILYVSDRVRSNVRAFEISGDGTLSKGRVAVELADRPRGLKTDEAGNLYVASEAGIRVFNAAGKHLGTIAVPEEPSNCNWGAGFRGLYITAQTSLYYLPTRVPGTRTY